MTWTRLIGSFVELFISVVVSVFVIFFSYRIFIKANTDFDEEEEIKKGNISVGILLAAIMVASAMIIEKGLFPIMSLIRLYFNSPVRGELAKWQLPLYALAHFILVFGLAVVTISFSLRLYGRLTARLQEGKELLRGNVAVGMILSAVVIIVAMYVSDGIGAVARALIPQISIGRIQVFP